MPQSKGRCTGAGRRGTTPTPYAHGNVGASGRKHGLALNVLRGVARANFVRLMAWLMPLRTWKQIQHRWPSDTYVRGLGEAVPAGVSTASARVVFLPQCTPHIADQEPSCRLKSWQTDVVGLPTT